MSDQISSEKQSSIQKIYNSSTKLLELVNVLLETIKDYNTKFPRGLSQDIYEACFELGGELAVMEDFLEGVEDDDELDNGWEK